MALALALACKAQSRRLEYEGKRRGYDRCPACLSVRHIVRPSTARYSLVPVGGKTLTYSDTRLG
jgi:hypothetical protein